MSILKISQLSKRYRRFRHSPTVAVDTLDLNIEEPGQVIGFLGPNGSGKTTTIRCMLGLIKPSSGSVTLLGSEMPQGAAKALEKVGALVENPKFFEEFTGRRNLRLLGRIQGIRRKEIDQILDQVGLSDAADIKVKKYSLGMKQRLGVAATLLKNPELLVLDEPANGLDPAGIVEMRRLLRDLGDSGKTVFVSSHQLGEIEQVCDEVVIIDHGKVVTSGPVDTIVSSSSSTALIVTIENVDETRKVLEENGFVVSSRTNNQIEIKPAPENPAVITQILADASIYLTGLRSEEGNLEEVFLGLTKGRSGDKL
ncbi:MAG TPA: ABC transporter ATP-binding protein [Acidimicrobiales bacterium]|nr:ABC transporter ATP-binding protein [Acidimicrobiales bacterium]